MQHVARLKRENISEAVAAAVRAMIVDGRLADGERINEVRLSQALGVSRTPLREALSRLAAEGALTSSPNFGYFVRPLTFEELDQAYDIRPLLDPAALRLAGLPSPARIERLQTLNLQLAQTEDPEACIAIDDEWHMELLADCPNRILIELIQNIILRTRRYELALMRETANVARATEDHQRVIDALRHGDLEGACAALRGNMESGKPPLVAWLKTREANKRP